MTGKLAGAERDLVAQLAAAARGPRRNGLFAIWLFVRLCDGLTPPNQIGSRAHRRRALALEGRLSTLSMPAGLRRALTGAIRVLRDGTAADAARALDGLRPIVAETLGPQAERALEPDRFRHHGG